MAFLPSYLLKKPEKGASCIVPFFISVYRKKERLYMAYICTRSVQVSPLNVYIRNRGRIYMSVVVSIGAGVELLAFRGNSG